MLEKWPAQWIQGRTSADPRSHNPANKNSVSMCQKRRVNRRKEYTSSVTEGTADDEVIGSCVFAGDLAKLATVSTALSWIAGSRLAVDICTSSIPPLEVSSGCNGNG